MSRTLIVRDVPLSVREAVEADCAERNLSRANVVGEIVSTALGLPWEMSTIPHRPTRSHDAPWIFQWSDELLDRLDAHQRETGGAKNRIVAAMLAERYGLPVPSTGDRRGRDQSRNEAGQFLPKGAS